MRCTSVWKIIIPISPNVRNALCTCWYCCFCMLTSIHSFCWALLYPKREFSLSIFVPISLHLFPALDSIYFGIIPLASIELCCFYMCCTFPCHKIYDESICIMTHLHGNWYKYTQVYNVQHFQANVNQTTNVYDGKWYEPLSHPNMLAFGFACVHWIHTLHLHW